MSKQIFHDPDPAETKDWLQSLEGVIQKEGDQKADYLLSELTQAARSKGVVTSPGVISPYINTTINDPAVIPPEDSLIARNVSAFVRWNAMVMVAKANEGGKGLGGHIASYSSSSAMYEVGFNWFFKGPQSEHGAD
ncbi:MAG: pyruvate dehydrogenase (acetyl-transferring), homodimeric type, partial [Sphaerochaeta sp.]|nr:pyruvate dehydrogenase (acetyl-transferring), homodimeric type [Sphaerochaeta sp.]